MGSTGTVQTSLRGDESPKSRVSNASLEAKKFTEDQYRALDFAEDNERIVFTGPAGTGKTLLAIESARRAARHGRRTLFLCYNELLGEWLETELAPLSSIVDFDRVARRMLKISGLRAGDSETFWSQELPRAALAALSDDGGNNLKPYQEVIIDEAQDFLREGFIDFVDRSLIGGLRGGHLLLFGDFERQSLYDGADLTLAELKEGWIPDLVNARLRDNCRNTPRVAALASTLGRLDPDYRSIRREDDRIDPKIVEYRSDKEQQEALTDLLLDLLTEGFVPADIAVLSMRAHDMCFDKITGHGSKTRVADGGRPGRGVVFRSSVKRFKGLEAPVVIVTDIDDVASEEAQKLLYVAVTRPLNNLIMLMHTGARREARANLKGVP
jgi:IstB-like ATP binding protein/UvrD-like helicase C-terminal domain